MMLVVYCCHNYGACCCYSDIIPIYKNIHFHNKVFLMLQKGIVEVMLTILKCSRGMLFVFCPFYLEVYHSVSCTINCSV